MVDTELADRRELGRLHAYLAAIAVAGANAFGRSFLPRPAARLRQHT